MPKTTVTVKGLIGKPKIITPRTALAEVIVYDTDGKTTYKIRGFALGLLPQHLPVTVTGSKAEDGTIDVQELRLVTPISRPAYLAWIEAYKKSAQDYEDAMEEYRMEMQEHEDDPDDSRFPSPPIPKIPDSYSFLTPEYDKWLRKIAGSKKEAHALWEDMDSFLVDPALEAWTSEVEGRAWPDAPVEVIAKALFPYPVPANAKFWRCRYRPMACDYKDNSTEMTDSAKERMGRREELCKKHIAITDACRSHWLYTIITRTLAGVAVSQAGLEYLRNVSWEDTESLSRAIKHFKTASDAAFFYDYPILD